MPFWVLSGVPDIITHAKFYANRLRGFSAATPRKVPFPILFRTTLTTVLHYRADCDSWFYKPNKIWTLVFNLEILHYSRTQIIPLLLFAVNMHNGRKLSNVWLSY